MTEFNYTITDEVGIHARPAGVLAKTAKDLDSEITITKGEKTVGASKLMMLMGLGVKCGDTVKVTDGPLEGFLGTVEELDAEKDLVRVVVSMFGRETPVDLELDQVEPVEE